MMGICKGVYERYAVCGVPSLEVCNGDRFRLKLRTAAMSPSTEQIDPGRRISSFIGGEVGFVPILYRRAGRRVIFGFSVIVFSVTYRMATPVERTIPSLATTTDAHPIPCFVSTENFDTSGNIENRAIGCAFWRKHKPINVLSQRLPRDLYVSAQQGANLGSPFVEIRLPGLASSPDPHLGFYAHPFYWATYQLNGDFH